MRRTQADVVQEARARLRFSSNVNCDGSHFRLNETGLQEATRAFSLRVPSGIFSQVHPTIHTQLTRAAVEMFLLRKVTIVV